MCNKFVIDFNKLEDRSIYTKLAYDETWKESEESITDVTKEILGVLKDIWNNSAFSSEFAKTLNKGTYQLIIILPTIWTLLKNLPIGDSFFISTSKKQNVASANRKGNGFMG
ncbi:683_t:CDS:1 [Diversispora eburnea]|uniref:683_t:CDS:1 n=1 Tax=Diversispora eburnea TaxID=1213867 RepID=A0A9N9FSY6_9GLOM|nr:683_t:CDS:1 [Diversispora eburnea]